jgi:hypothetical protein
MPGFKFLFEVRKIKKGHAPSSDALQLAAGLVPKDSEVVPKPEAVELVAYLLSLKSNAPLYDAPVSVPATVATPNPTAAQ